jgi:predicted nucleic acid-binding protein
MTVVDSSGWLQFLTDAKRLRGEEGALDAVAAMRKTRIVPLNEELALNAADLSVELKLPMADAIILATARAFGAELVTSDGDFKEVPDVTYIPIPEPA